VARAVAQALEEELTQRQREMVRLYYIEQYPMREIARQLEVNPSTVTRTLQVARAKLKVCLQYCGGLLENEGN